MPIQFLEEIIEHNYLNSFFSDFIRENKQKFNRENKFDELTDFCSIFDIDEEKKEIIIFCVPVTIGEVTERFKTVISFKDEYLPEIIKVETQK